MEQQAKSSDKRSLEMAAERTLSGFELATKHHGSILQCLIQGQTVRAFDHYPSENVIDHASGAQYFYHSHRDDNLEHGHLHLFWHADALGRRSQREHVQSSSGWAPTHLLAIGLASNGLPTSFFTTNQWVTGGYWFDASRTLKMLARFNLDETGPYAPVNQFINGILSLYQARIAQLLVARDQAIASQLRHHNRQTLQEKELAEIPSHTTVDWMADLAKL